MTDVIKKKYEIIKDNLFGINDYLKLLGIDDIFPNEQIYKELINYLAEEMFSSSKSVSEVSEPTASEASSIPVGTSSSE